MNWILMAMGFLAVLVVSMTMIIYRGLKRSSCSIHVSRYILNKCELEDASQKLTEMIEFHKEHKNLSKYNIE